MHAHVCKWNHYFVNMIQADERDAQQIGEEALHCFLHKCMLPKSSPPFTSMEEPSRAQGPSCVNTLYLICFLSLYFFSIPTYHPQAKKMHVYLCVCMWILWRGMYCACMKLYFWHFCVVVMNILKWLMIEKTNSTVEIIIYNFTCSFT